MDEAIAHADNGLPGNRRGFLSEALRSERGDLSCVWRGRTSVNSAKAAHSTGPHTPERFFNST